MIRIPLSALAVACALLPVSASAKPPLGDVPAIRDGLIDVAIAYEISEVCPSIKARLLAGIGRLNGLKQAARNMGYSRSEVDAFIDNDAEKDRLEALARAKLARLGAARGDVDAHCRVGRSEMSRQSAIGTLLR